MEKKGLKKVQKNKKQIIILGSVLVLAIVAVFGVTYARYVTNVTGTSSARVAKFAFDLNGANASTSTQTLAIDDLFNYTYNNGTVVGASNADVIAPGTSGYVKIMLQNNGEVAIIPDWIITETNASKVPLQYQISTSTTADSSKWAAASSLIPTENFIAIGSNQTYYLHWRWNSSSDASDTALGVAGTATVSIKVDCTVSQYIGS